MIASGAAADPEPGDTGRELTELALAGAGWPVLLDKLAVLTGRACRLTAGDGTVLAATDGGAGLTREEAKSAGRARGASRVVAIDGVPARAVPARAGEHLHALILVAEPVSARHVDLAAAAVTGVLVESVRRRAAGAGLLADGAAVIAALRAGELDTATLVSAAARCGLDLSRPGCAAVLRHVGPRHRAWATALSWLDRPVQQQDADAFCVVGDAADLARVRTRLERAIGEGRVLAACGPATEHAQRYAAAFRTARALLPHVPVSGQLAFDDSGLLQILLAVPRDRLEYFVQRQLRPVLDRPELLETLRHWLATDGSRLLVSEQLHLHRNSVGYRVRQLKALLGVDPLDPAARAVLQAALLARRVLAVESPCCATSISTARPIDTPGAQP